MAELKSKGLRIKFAMSGRCAESRPVISKALSVPAHEPEGLLRHLLWARSSLGRTLKTYDDPDATFDFIEERALKCEASCRLISERASPF
jgi:hypothetical protein